MEKLFCKTGITISLRCLLIVASLLFGSSAWGQTEITWNSPSAWTGIGTTYISYTSGDFTISASRASGSTSPTVNSKSYDFRAYAKNTFTVTSSNDNITRIVFFISTNGKKRWTDVAPNTGTTTVDKTAYTTSWEGDAKEITFTVGENATYGTDGSSKAGQFCIDKLVIYTSGGGGETTLTDRNLSFGETESFDAEVGGTFTAPTLTGVTDGVTYESSNETVASVNASTGAVTIVGMGHAQIKASAAENETYKAGSASYDIYVYGKGTIDDLKAYITSSTAKDIYFNLTSTAVVTYAATNYAYMEDGHAGIYIYKSGHGLTAGNSFTGKVKATGTLYKELYELTSFTPTNAAGSADIPVSDWIIKDLLESENTGYKMAESMRVKLTGVTAATSATGTSCTIEQEGYSTTLSLFNSLSVTAGSTYDITGYPYNNNGTWQFRVYEESCLEQKGGKTAATVTFDQESYTVETNGSITVTATTNSTAAIVYSISPADENVVIDAETGDIVVGATAGTYTITASVAENEYYTEASANCVLTVTAPAPPSYNITAPTYYKKITSTDELAAGGTYLIVCEGSEKGLSESVATTDYTQGENNTITNETAATLGEFELVNTNESYGDAPLYQFAINNKYLHGTTSTTLSMKNTIANETKWTIDFDESGNVNITNYATIVANDTRLVYFNKDGNYIRHYLKSKVSASNYIPVQLYQKVTDLSISTLTNGYATFVTDVPYVMPKGACGYAVTVAQQVGVITKKEAYTEGAQVPARTALLIGGASGTNYYPAVLKENVAASYNGKNYMEGKRTADGYTDSQRGGDVYYYKLALNDESKPGFYYGAADGAAFKLTKPTTAFLAVPKSITPVNGYLIDFEGETTGIDSIGQTDGNANGAIYNLNGIRMAQPLRSLPKGVYVVNGKKIIK